MYGLDPINRKKFISLFKGIKKKLRREKMLKNSYLKRSYKIKWLE